MTDPSPLPKAPIDEQIAQIEKDMLFLGDTMSPHNIWFQHLQWLLSTLQAHRSALQEAKWALESFVNQDHGEGNETSRISQELLSKLSFL